MLSFRTLESDLVLSLFPMEMVAVYRGRFVPVTKDRERDIESERETLREKEIEGRYREKEPVQRCNWYLSFFRKHFLLTEVQQMSQGAACFITTLRHSHMVYHTFPL